MLFGSEKPESAKKCHVLYGPLSENVSNQIVFPRSNSGIINKLEFIFLTVIRYNR